MHEASIAQSIVQTVLQEAAKQNASRVESVEIEIGELTFLGSEQIEFWVKTGFQGSIAKNAVIHFKEVKGRILCEECGFDGDLKTQDDPIYHTTLPTFNCPKCQSTKIKITQGKEAIIQRIKIIKD
ncbi:hydrogenase maturation nickel metallochaperone HypA [bacterium]